MVQPVGSLSVILGAVLVARAAAGGPCRGELEIDFTWTSGTGLLLPSAVTVDADGQVYVCDGVNDRILRFDSQGRPVEEISAVAGHRLKRPLSIRIDSQGRLWIADTGNDRILVRAPTGELVRSLRPIITERGQRWDVTDVLPTPDQAAVWCVDNDGHALLRIELSDGRTTRVGRQGAALGQLDHPFMIAGGVAGDLFITDVLNGRVAVFNASGQPVRVVGQYGLQPGQFYRPKGIAVDGHGRVWVSDTVLGVVQVFDHDGAFIGVLRGDSGVPLRFEEPAGLAFDADGRLYLVEAAANRVRRLRVFVDPAAPRETTPRITLASPQPRVCTACHLEWMAPLASGQATELVAVLENPPQYPLVSRAAACRSCHDGTVVDSRRRVWVEHSHREGLTPPIGMAVGTDLPLVDGRIACRTCHSAHTRGGSGNLLKEAVFLRVNRDPGELCRHCHVGFDAGLAGGMHPLAAVQPADAPDAPTTSDDAPLATCLSCHEAHGSRQTHLLKIDPASNEGCLACHVAVNAALFEHAARRPHAHQPVLSTAQRELVAELGTPTGPGGELLCRSCHRVHHAPFGAHLLAFDPADDAVCRGCHESQVHVRGTAHDLRPSPTAGDEPASAADENVCSHCHRAHRDTRTPRPTALDSSGRCTACHGADDFPSATALGSFNHPRAGCTDCHDPHAGAYGAFMQSAPAQVCGRCHATAADLADGPHDVRRASKKWPAASAATTDPCLACHRPHGRQAAERWRAGLAAGSEARDAACLACHADAAPDSAGSAALLHPQRALADAGVALTTQSAQILCRSCHDPHVSTAKLRRLLPGAAPQQLCLVCHSDFAQIDMVGHAPQFLAAAGFQSEGCRPCHRVHGVAATTERAGLWPQELCRDAGSLGDYEPLPLDQRCLCCHRADGPAPLPAAITHPDVEMYNPEPPGSAQHLPLFNAAGGVDPTGRMSCHTCHLTHGRTEPIPLPEGLQSLSPREIRARVWHIRRFVTPNLCTICHGADAWRRFMYFHDPQRRSGRLDAATTSVSR